MRIDHVALYCLDLEGMKDFFIRYFNGIPNDMFRELMPELMEQRGQSQAGLNSAESRQKSTNGQLANEFHRYCSGFSGITLKPLILLLT